MTSATYCVHCGLAIEACKCDDVKPARSVFDVIRTKPTTPAEIIAALDEATAASRAVRPPGPMVTIDRSTRTRNTGKRR